MRSSLESCSFCAVAAVGAGALVQVLGEGFGQTVGEGGGHDGVVVVVVAPEVFGQRFRADARRDSEAADVVGDAGLFGRDEVGEALVGVVAALFPLLTQVVNDGSDFGTGVVGVNLNVVADAVGGPEAVDGAGGERACRG